MNKKKTRISLIIVALVFVLSIVTSVVSFADDSIDINETNFTDPVFRAAIKLNYDLDNDDKLSPEERNVTTMLVSGLVDELAESRGVDVDTLTISSLKGIEYFDNLRALYCGHIGELESLDVSSLSQLETLNCSDNGLTSLDVSANTELKMLYCMSNEFTELDFSANSNLELIHCYTNLNLKSLNVNSLTNLEELRCDVCQLTSLDLSTNTALDALNCSYNRLSKLDLSNTDISSLTDYNLGNQNISLELIYEDGLIKAPIDLDAASVYSTSLDEDEKAFKDGAFFTTDYSKVENGFSYLYSTGKSGCAEMNVSVSTYHTHTYAVSASDKENKKLTVKCQICGLEHVLDADVSSVTTDAGCVTDGETKYTVTAEFESVTYSDVITVVIPALGHHYVATVTDPTCLEQGYTTYKCSRCDDSYVDDYVDPLGHAFGDWTEEAPAVAPKCLEAGKTAVDKRTCTRCDAYETRGGTEVPALGHDIVDAVTQPTCTEQGYTTHTCTRCDYVSVDTYTDPLGHTDGAPVRENEVEAKCLINGSYDEVTYCTVCKAETSRTPHNIDALGHNFGDWFVVEEEVKPTCTNKGKTAVERRNCTRCEEYETKGGADINPLGHTDGAPVRENEVEAKCLINGSYDEVTYCTVCKAETSRTPHNIDALGHNFGDWFVAEEEVKPTCTNKGKTAVERRNCTRCEEYETKGGADINPLGHTDGAPVRENEVAATCTIDGSYDEVVYCTVCKEEQSRTQRTIIAPGHTDGAPVRENEVDAKCLTDGSYDEVTYCTVCKVETSRTPHTIKATGQHTNGEPVRENEVEAKCLTDGSYDEVVYCTVCKAETSRTPHNIDALGHNFGDWFVAEEEVKPTCTNKGKTAVERRNCTRCEEYETKGGADINPLGHTNGAPVIENEVAATCTIDGSYDEVVYCTVCKEEQSRTQRTITAPGHTDGEPVRENEVDAKCLTDGSYDEVTYCSVCGDETSRTPHTIPALGHIEESVAALAPTCTETGLTSGVKCSRCGEILTAQQVVDALGHKWDDGKVTQEPTVLAEGKRTFTCTVCGATRDEAIAKLTLAEVTPTEKEADNAVVNKSIKKPSKIHTISYSKKKQLYIYFSPVSGAQNYRIMYRKQGAKKWKKAWTKGKTEYTLKNLKNNGLYEFKFSAYKKNAQGKWERGDYSTTSYRYYFKEKITKATAKKKAVTLKWNRDNNANYYIIEYADNKDMNNNKRITVSPKSKTSYTVKKLKKGKKYYFRVRSVKKKAGKDYQGEFSNKSAVKVK